MSVTYRELIMDDSIHAAVTNIGLLRKLLRQLMASFHAVLDLANMLL